MTKINPDNWKRSGTPVRRRDGYSYTKWRWIEKATGRHATATEARMLNAWRANNPSAMSLPGVHPSYRV